MPSKTRVLLLATPLLGALACLFRPPPRPPSTPPVPPAAPHIEPPPPPPEPPPPGYATLHEPRQVTAPRGNGITLLPGSALPRRSPPPLITVLHGMCLSPQENCAFLRAIADERAILVCPAGNVACTDGSKTWEAAPNARAAYVEESAATAERALDMDIDPRRGDVLFGSSRGAFVARDVIYEGKQKRWSGLVLVGAAIVPDPDKVRRAGVQRVLLAAPDFDGAASTMRRGHAILCGAGIPARFVSLGPHPHGMVDDSPAILARHLDWVMGKGEPGPCARPSARGG